MLDRVVELEAELADVGDAQRQRRHARHLEVPRAKERERLPRDVILDQGLEQLPGARACESEDAVALGFVVELHRAVVRQMPLEPGVVVQLRGRCGDHIEALRLGTGDRHVALDPAARPAHLRQRDSPDRREAVGTETIEESLRARTRDAVLGEARLVEHAHRRAHGPALLADRLVPVSPPHGVLVSVAVAARTTAAAPSRTGSPSRRLARTARRAGRPASAAARRRAPPPGSGSRTRVRRRRSPAGRGTTPTARTRRSGGRRAPTCCRSAGRRRSTRLRSARRRPRRRCRRC